MYIPFIVKLLLSWLYGDSNDLIIQKKSEKPLEICKRATDPIRGEPPQNQSINHISKSNESSPEVS